MGLVISELEQMKPALRRAAARAIGPAPCRRSADELAARLLLEIDADPELMRFRRNWSITATLKPRALLFDLRSRDEMVTIDASSPSTQMLVYASLPKVTVTVDLASEAFIPLLVDLLRKAKAVVGDVPPWLRLPTTNRPRAVHRPLRVQRFSSGD